MRKLQLPSSVIAVVSKSGRLCASSGRKICLASLDEWKRLASVSLLSNTSHMQFSPDETKLIMKNTSGELLLADVPDLKVLAKRTGVYEEGSEIHFSQCGQFLIDGSWRGRLAVSRASDLSIEHVWDYPNEMISHVSMNAEKSLCLVSHTPRTKPGKNFAEPPYLELLGWPFGEPRRIELSLDILYAAQMSPSGDEILVVGHSRAERRTVIRLLDTNSQIICSRDYEGVVYRVRWISSSLVAVVTGSAYVIFGLPALTEVWAIQAPSASDIFLTKDGKSVFLGTPQKGTFVEWGGKA